MADNHTTFAYFYLDSAPFGYSYAINPIVNDTFTMGFIFVTVGLEPQVRVWGARGALPVAGLSYIRLRRAEFAAQAKLPAGS